MARASGPSHSSTADLVATAGIVDWLRTNVAADADLASDSRRVAQGDVFFACPGDANDGRRFIPQALAQGAGAVLWDDHDFNWNDAWQVPNRGIAQLKSVAGPIADAWYAHPSASMLTIGITGTNGKTSCSQWIAQALSAAGMRCAVVGTLGSGFPGALIETGYTTPDAVMLQRSLVELRQQSARAVALEVSSIGLAQGRVNGMHFDIAVLTNLTRDHLDYHGSMQAYEAAKAALFDWPGLKHAILNLDDAMGCRLADRIGLRPTGASAVRVWTYAIDAAWANARADVRAINVRSTAHGTAFQAVTPLGVIDIETGLLGLFNVSNALAALTVLLAAGISLNEAAKHIAALTPPPGRMQTVTAEGAPLAVVDYAHTPDALEKVLNALRPVAEARGGRLITVFGCGGDRDAGKRPLMGRIVSQLADAVVVTSDNPRGENPLTIIDLILEGIVEAQGDEIRAENRADTKDNNARITVQVDRRSAIRATLFNASARDVVLIAGKGHEAYQEIAGTKHPFSDVDEAYAALHDRSAQGDKDETC